MNIVLFGAGGHAEVIVDMINIAGKHTVLGVITENGQEALSTMGGVPVIGNDSELLFLSQEMQFNHGIIGIYDNYVRFNLKNRILDMLPNFEFVTVIHPHANISESAKIGEGSVIMGGVTINTGSLIGAHCVLNTNSSVDHHCVISNGASIGPGVNLGGHVKLGECSYVGIGSAISHNVSVGRHTVIGGMSYVNKDVGDLEIGYSSPYKKIKSRQLGDKYL